MNIIHPIRIYFALIVAVAFSAIVGTDAAAHQVAVRSPQESMAVIASSTPIRELQVTQATPSGKDASTVKPVAVVKTLPVVPRQAQPGPVISPKAAATTAAGVVEPKPITASGPIIPARLVIPRIGVNAPVGAFGLEPDGKMAVPNNFTEVGWYKLGSKPGELGSAVMGAHVDNGGSVSGVFKHLKNLSVGDEIRVQNSHGEELEFRIVETRLYDYREKSTGEIFGNVGKKRLNLITCHGTYMPELDTYDQRLIVFAELVE